MGEPDFFPRQPKHVNVPGKVTFHVEITYTTGAPGTVKGKDIVGVQDSGTGQMTITFPRTYRRLCGFRWGWTKLSAGAVYFPVVVDKTTLASAGTLVIETRAEAGTATDPASGSVLSLEFDATNDVLDDGYPVTVS